MNTLNYMEEILQDSVGVALNFDPLITTKSDLAEFKASFLRYSRTLDLLNLVEMKKLNKNLENICNALQQRQHVATSDVTLRK